MTKTSTPGEHHTLWKLECHHELMFTHSPPKVGEIMWCRACGGKERAVTRKVPRSQQFKVNCLNCRYARNMGAAELTAKVKATKHAFAKPGHTVEVRDGNNKLIQRSARDPETETELPGF